MYGVTKATTKAGVKTGNFENTNRRSLTGYIHKEE
jgi:hypothetical protein